MAKKPISSGDLEWIIVEQLRDSGIQWVSVSVVADGQRGGWRIVIPVRTRPYLRDGSRQRVAAIEKRLRAVYALADQRK